MRGFALADVLSRSEETMATLVAEFKTMNPQNGYRNDWGERIYNAITAPSKLMEHPTGEVFFGESKLIIDTNSGWDVHDELVPVYFNGFVKSSLDTGLDTGRLALAMESAIHDLKRLVAKLLTKYIDNQKNAWMVSRKAGDIVVARYLLDLTGNAMIQLRFWIRIRSENQDFTS